MESNEIHAARIGSIEIPMKSFVESYCILMKSFEKSNGIQWNASEAHYHKDLLSNSDNNNNNNNK